MTNETQRPEDDDFVQSHPAVEELRRIQAMWKRTGLSDPRIESYKRAVDTARKNGMDEYTAVLFAAKAVTGR